MYYRKTNLNYKIDRKKKTFQLRTLIKYKNIKQKVFKKNQLNYKYKLKVSKNPITHTKYAINENIKHEKHNI